MLLGLASIACSYTESRQIPNLSMINGTSERTELNHAAILTQWILMKFIACARNVSQEKTVTTGFNALGAISGTTTAAFFRPKAYY